MKNKLIWVYEASRTYESRRDVLHKIPNTVGGVDLSSFQYTVDDLGHRGVLDRTGAGGSEHLVW